MATNLAVNIRIRAVDNFTAVTKRLNDDIKKVSKEISKSAKAFQLAANINQASAAVGRFASVARKAVSGPIEKAMAFEAAMVQVKAKTDGIIDSQGNMSAKGAKAFAELEAKALEMGRTTEFTAIQSADALAFLATAGFKAEKQLATIGPIMDLASAGAMDLARASDIAGDLMGSFGLEGETVAETTKNMTKVVDVLAATATSTNTTVETLFETMKLSAPDATALGIEIEQLAAFTGVLGSAGLKGSLAGTAMRSMMTKLVKPTSKAAGILKEFGTVITDDKLKDMPALFGEIAGQLGKMSKVQSSAVLSEIFGTRAKTATGVLISSLRGDKLQDLVEKLKTGSEGVAAAIAKVQRDTAKGDVQKFESAVEGLEIAIGKKLLPAFRDAVQWSNKVVDAVSKWVDENPELTKTIGLITAGLAIAATALAGFLTSIATIAAAVGGVLFVIGPMTTAAGLLGTALGVVGGAIKVAAVFLAKFIASLVVFAAKAAVGAIVALGKMAAAAWAAAPAVAASFAPFLLGAIAIGAVTLAIRELVKAWDQLDASEAIQGIKDVVGEDGVLSAIGQAFDPSALLQSVGLTEGGATQSELDRRAANAATFKASQEAAAARSGGSVGVAGRIQIDVRDPGGLTTASVVQSEGPIDIEASAGMSGSLVGG